MVTHPQFYIVYALNSNSPKRGIDHFHFSIELLGIPVPHSVYHLSSCESLFCSVI